MTIRQLAAVAFLAITCAARPAASMEQSRAGVSATVAAVADRRATPRAARAGNACAEPARTDTASATEVTLVFAGPSTQHTVREWRFGVTTPLAPQLAPGRGFAFPVRAAASPWLSFGNTVVVKRDAPEVDWSSGVFTLFGAHATPLRSVASTR